MKLEIEDEHGNKLRYDNIGEIAKLLSGILDIMGQANVADFSYTLKYDSGNKEILSKGTFKRDRY